MYGLEDIQKMVLDFVNNEIEAKEPITDLDVSGFDQGLDSISAVDITNTLEDQLKIDLDPSLFWEFESLREMCEHLYSQTLKNG